MALHCDTKRSGVRSAANGLRSQSKIDPSDAAAVLCTRKERGSIWQSEVRLKGAAGDTPKDVSPDWTILALHERFSKKSFNGQCPASGITLLASNFLGPYDQPLKNSPPGRGEILLLSRGGKCLATTI